MYTATPIPAAPTGPSSGGSTPHLWSAAATIAGLTGMALALFSLVSRRSSASSSASSAASFSPAAAIDRATARWRSSAAAASVLSCSPAAMSACKAAALSSLRTMSFSSTAIRLSLPFSSSSINPPCSVLRRSPRSGGSRAGHLPQTRIEFQLSL